MQIIKEDKTAEKISFDLQLQPEDWKHALEKARANAIKNVKLDGYRPGKVPAEIAKKYISLEDVYVKAVNSLLPKLIEDFETNTEQFKKINEEVISESRFVEIVKVDDSEAVVKITYDVFPTVTIGDYHDHDLPEFKAPVVSEGEVTAELAKVARSRKIVEEKTAGVLEKGDIAVFDFTGYKNGEKFAGGSAKNYELEIGSNQFIPGFEDQMVGMKLGEERDLNLTFPEDYSAKDLAGQAVVFKVHLNEMKLVILPEVTDDLIKELNITGVNTVKEYIDYFKHQIVANAEQNFMSEQTSKIVEFIIKITTVSHIPAIMVREERQALYDNYNNQLKQQGLSVEQFLSITKQPKEEFEKKLDEEAHRSVIVSLGMEEIAKKAKIEVTEKDIMDYIEKVTKIYGGDAKEIREKIGDQTDRIESTILQQKVFDVVAGVGESKETKTRKVRAKKSPEPSSVEVAPEAEETKEVSPKKTRRSKSPVKADSAEQKSDLNDQVLTKEPKKTEAKARVSNSKKGPSKKSSSEKVGDADAEKPREVMPKTVTEQPKSHRAKHQEWTMEIPDTLKYDGEANDFHIDPDKEIAELRAREIRLEAREKRVAKKEAAQKASDLPADHEKTTHQSGKKAKGLTTKTTTKKTSGGNKEAKSVEPKVQQKVTPISQYVEIVENVDSNEKSDQDK